VKEVFRGSLNRLSEFGCKPIVADFRAKFTQIVLKKDT
jgi:hypothetical protein